MTGPRRHDGRNRAVLAIDTATTRVVVAVGDRHGRPLGQSTWLAGYRHGEQLLPSIDRLLGEANVRRSRLEAVIVGTGPGAFTGLRVGIATAKGLAHGLGVPIAGVATSAALIAAAAASGEISERRIVLLVPAGPSDRVACRLGMPPRLLPGGSDPTLGRDDIVVAVDLEGRAPEVAVTAGERAREGLGRELLRLGVERLGETNGDDLATLVPEYVTLPRGVAATEGVVEWSRDPR